MHQTRANKSAKPKARTINGLLLLDKPEGLTSNAILQRVKHLFQAKKAGHTGSLDPLATGLLPICLGRATKFSQFLLNADKTYTVVAKLGQRTTTSDSEGEVVSERDVPALSAEKLEFVLQKFRGEQQQMPSIYSAIKYQGKPLYSYARRGISVPRQSRSITVYEMKLLELSSETISLHIRCSKGTYVRTLVDDIGEVLGCGAHVIALRRIEVTPYVGEQMVKFDDLQQLAEENLALLDRQLLPVQTMVVNFPKVTLARQEIFYLRNGKSLPASTLVPQGYCQLSDQSQRFLGVGHMPEDGRIKAVCWL